MDVDIRWACTCVVNKLTSTKKIRFENFITLNCFPGESEGINGMEIKGNKMFQIPFAKTQRFLFICFERNRASR